MLEKLEEIVNFVLKFHNCNREYEIYEDPTNPLELRKNMKKTDKELCRNPIYTDTHSEEHGVYGKDLQEHIKNEPIEFLVAVDGDGKPHFYIIIFPIFWTLPYVEQLRELIHEARHIVDFPVINKPNKALDFALLKEFLRQKD
jgi:hypothetical protein